MSENLPVRVGSSDSPVKGLLCLVLPSLLKLLMVLGFEFDGICPKRKKTLAHMLFTNSLIPFSMLIELNSFETSWSPEGAQEAALSRID